MQHELNHPVRATRGSPTVMTYTDLSRKGQEQQRQLYTTLLHLWWPHPVHGGVKLTFTPDAMVFICKCGDRLQMDHEDAYALGLLGS